MTTHPVHSTPVGWRERAWRVGSSFPLALALLAAVYLVGELLADRTWAFVATWPLITGAMVVILNATIASRRWRVAFLVVATGSYAIGLAGLATGVEDIEGTGSELPFLYVAGALLLTLRHIRGQSRVTIDAVFAALCAYLLLGMLFGFLYTGIANADPNLFAPPQDPAEHGGLFYFSLVTLTTVGYGDIVPAADWVRALAVLEAIAGQVFLVVLVARLVGMEIAQHEREAIRRDTTDRS